MNIKKCEKCGKQTEFETIIKILNEKNKKEKRVFEYFQNYLMEIRDEIDYEMYKEMDETLNLLISD